LTDAQFCSRCGNARQIGHEIADGSGNEEWQVQGWLSISGRTKTQLVKGLTSKTMTLGNWHTRQFSEEQKAHKKIESRFLLDYLVHQPIKPGRLAYDAFGAVFILYEAVLISLQVFPIKDTPFTHFMAILIASYWTASMISSFFISYIRNEAMATRAKQTASHYIKTWFLFDALVLMPDWVALSAGSSDDDRVVGFEFKLLRVVRLLKVLRLLRVIKLFSIAARVGEYVNRLVNPCFGIPMQVLTTPKS